MIVNKFEKMLVLINNPVIITGHRHIITVRKTVREGHLTLVSSINHSGWKSSFENPGSTTTYEECVDLTIRLDGQLELTIWDGNSQGYPDNKRSTYMFEGEWWQIPFLAACVESRFKVFTMGILQKEIDGELELRRWIIATRMLGG